MSHLLFEAAQARIADLHREAENAGRAALARSGGSPTALRRRRPRLGLLTARRRDDERTPRPASATP